MPWARALPICVLTAVIASCHAPLPRGAREAPPATHALRQEPLRAAACIARNVDRYRSPYSAQIVAAPPPAVAAVLVSAAETVAVARLYTAPGDTSAVHVRRTSAPAFGLDELLAAMIEGC